ncbi:MAG: lipoate--protein ligase [Clostridia bacterium]|nr:lipoate--protein ligase [Clostridia bacterium]
MIQKLQYYISTSLDPHENLATEKYLLDTVPEDGCTLYLWQNQNTVVIGKNQNPWAECRCDLLKAENGKLARRLSGGGAVFHDIGNLNFTFLCTAENYDLARQMQVIRTACALAGIDTELSGRNDLLAGGRKFSGNAFYNAKGKAYHHGTLLICADLERMQRYLTPPKAKLEAKGVKSVGARVVNLSELAKDLTCQKMQSHMLAAFETVYGYTPTEICPPDVKTIAALAKAYSSWDYLYGTTIPFTAAAEAQFAWGHTKLLLQIRSGKITDAQLFTDAMDAALADTVCALLTGCRLDKTEISHKLAIKLDAELVSDLSSLFEQIM